jgi:hypothetical protein
MLAGGDGYTVFKNPIAIIHTQHLWRKAVEEGLAYETENFKRVQHRNETRIVNLQKK